MGEYMVLVMGLNLDSELFRRSALSWFNFYRESNNYGGLRNLISKDIFHWTAMVVLIWVKSRERGAWKHVLYASRDSHRWP
jgi:hypothetical protein